MYRDEILDKSLASLSNEAQKILREYGIRNLYDVAFWMCDDVDNVRKFENEVISDFPEKDLIKLRKLLLKNNCYSRIRHAEHLKSVIKLQISVTAGTFRPAGYLQSVTEEYTIDRIQGKIHVKHVNGEGKIIKNINICVPDSEMSFFFFLADEAFYNGVCLDGKGVLDAPKHEISIVYSDNTIIDDWGYDSKIYKYIEYIEKIVIDSILL